MNDVLRIILSNDNVENDAWKWLIIPKNCNDIKKKQPSCELELLVDSQLIRTLARSGHDN